VGSLNAQTEEGHGIAVGVRGIRLANGHKSALNAVGKLTVNNKKEE